MSGFVVCRACGTRIKAGREHCLKCFAPLPAPDEPVKPPLSESLGLSEQSQMMVGAIVLAIVIGLVYVIWTSEKPAIEEPIVTTNPAQSIPATPTSPAPGTTAAATPSSAPDGSSSAAGDTAPPMPPVPETVKADPDTPVDQALDQQREQYVAQVGRAPKDAASHNKLALVLAQMGRNEEALKELREAIASAPRDPSYRANLANLALANGAWGDAITQYHEVLLLNRNDFAAELGLAIALQRKGDHELAVTEFLKARHMNPDAPIVAMGLGASLERLGRRADAVKEYRDFVKLQPASRETERVRVYLATLR